MSLPPRCFFISLLVPARSLACTQREKLHFAGCYLSDSAANQHGCPTHLRRGATGSLQENRARPTAALITNTFLIHGRKSSSRRFPKRSYMVEHRPRELGQQYWYRYWYCVSRPESTGETKSSVLRAAPKALPAPGSPAARQNCPEE
jgi:hypothetical protein